MNEDKLPQDETSRLQWRRPALMFGLTVLSLIYTGASQSPAAEGVASPWALLRSAGPLHDGLAYAASLAAILLAHEFGHYIAARIHGVPASLPFFIPVPSPLSPFGTFGAVIGMRGRFPSRNALLDIGASGPLAGLAVALPLYAWGVRHSSVVPLEPGMTSLGNSLALRALDGLFAPSVPPGYDILLSPVAFAAWAGMFVTFVNLLPLGQLDGGHVAYALFGKRQNAFAKHIHRGLLAFFLVSLVGNVLVSLRVGAGLARFGSSVAHSLFFLSWFMLLPVLGLATKPPTERAKDLGIRTRLVVLLAILLTAGVGQGKSSPFFWGAWLLAVGMFLVMERRKGTLREHTLFDHPPVIFSAPPLSPPRKVIAVVTLAMYALLFMPTPMSV